MNLAVLISTTSAAAATAVGLVALAVSRARTWRELRWFAGVAFASAAYAVGNIATSAGLEPATVVRLSRVQTAAALAEVFCWLGFADALMGRRPGRVEHRLRQALITASALALIPGVAFGGAVVDRPFAPWGMVYRDALPTPFGAALFFVALAGGALVTARFWRARHALRHGRLIAAAFGTLLLLGASDALGSAGVLPTPYLLDLGFLLPVAVLAYASAARFADDAETLARLRGRLETLVAERTKALTNAIDALHQAEKLAALGQFAAGVAHEVNSPASVVMSNLRYLAETAAEEGAPGDAQAAIAESLEAMQRINGLVRKLVDAGRLARTPAPSDRAGLLSVAQQAVEEARLRAGDRVAFTVTVSPAYQVAVRPEVLHQVFAALLANAADAVSPGRLGRIEVGAVPVEDGRLRAIVSDDGHGMAPDVLRRAFEPFFSTKGEGRGSGLGLPVARALVESHGGELTLESEPGQGTKAILDLPEARPAS